MPKRILIDATHVEETRVVVLENGRVSEFDSETSIKQQLKGNIYLAKITRVEPSLQAAFVDYGGEKHGFLPFSEIHPDYYNIPVADKQELLRSLRGKVSEDADDDETEESENPNPQESDSTKQVEGTDGSKEEVDVLGEIEPIDEAGETTLKDPNLYRRYKIQEVIKRGQIVLIQVEKEERGNKGASLTTFVSLAGRFCVLMPNSLRKGGVSRRIESREDRKRLKAVIKELAIPEEKGIIIRTAGAKRSAQDIKDDYGYLAELWNKIRQATLESTAPAFIHAEGDIIKRSMRDLYNEGIDEVIIEGDEAFARAKDFTKMVMAGNTSHIKKYKNKVPIFSRYKVEEQIASLYKQEVTLESGGALVINPTEALISIDVNSGRSTGQRSVEETALSTNLEAAREAALQLRLRDLSGLIVIDFIDMMDLRNKKAVERELRNALQNDKARIQVGRISTFGLLEMSRQRLAPSFLETNTMVCPHCEGAGVVKATESTAVTVLRAIENDVSRGAKCKAVEVFVANDVAIYLINHKRRQITLIEDKYDVRIIITMDNSYGADSFYIDRLKTFESEEETRRAPKKSAADMLISDNTNVTDSEDDPAKEKDDDKKKKHHDLKSPDKQKEPQQKKTLLSGLWKKIID